MTHSDKNKKKNKSSNTSFKLNIQQCVLKHQDYNNRDKTVKKIDDDSCTTINVSILITPD